MNFRMLNVNFRTENLLFIIKHHSSESDFNFIYFGAKFNRFEKRNIKMIQPNKNSDLKYFFF